MKKFKLFQIFISVLGDRRSFPEYKPVIDSQNYEFDDLNFLKSLPAWNKIQSDEFYDLAYKYLPGQTKSSEREFNDEISWKDYR